MEAEQAQRTELATLGGGCFWCVEAILEQLQGVERVTSGYSGGHVPSPSYELVCTGTTGHAEVVQVEFDPRQISFDDLLRVFFSAHDPTTPNRQGNDVGPQYRSVIFYHTREQKEQAERVIRELEGEGIWQGIVTELTPFERFFPAERYHQEYYRNNTNQPYCAVVIAPKVAKFRKTHLERLKPAFGGRG